MAAPPPDFVDKLYALEAIMSNVAKEIKAAGVMQDNLNLQVRLVARLEEVKALVDEALSVEG